MKVRLGFVSNSSSSSFVFIGIKLKDDDDEDVALINENLIDKMEDEGEVEILNDDYFSLAGDSVAQFYDDEGLNEHALSEFNFDIKDVHLRLKKYFPDLKEEEIKLFSGTRMC